MNDKLRNVGTVTLNILLIIGLFFLKEMRGDIKVLATTISVHIQEYKEFKGIVETQLQYKIK